MDCPRCGRSLSGETCSHCEGGQRPSGHLPVEVSVSLQSRAEESPPLFDYRVGEEPEREPPARVVAATTGDPSRVVDRPLIRTPVGRRASHLPKQQKLSLEALPSYGPAPTPLDTRARDSLSREVLFSRFLAGIIDVMLPALLGLLFSLTASRILNFDFFSTPTFWFVMSFSICFFFFNSFFFLVLSGQTPGMYFTDLKLTGERREEVPVSSLSLRILFFLPVAASVLGLVWALSDPFCRCWHDRLSSTRVVPRE